MKAYFAHIFWPTGWLSYKPQPVPTLHIRFADETHEIQRLMGAGRRAILENTILDEESECLVGQIQIRYAPQQIETVRGHELWMPGKDMLLYVSPKLCRSLLHEQQYLYHADRHFLLTVWQTELNRGSHRYV